MIVHKARFKLCYIYLAFVNKERNLKKDYFQNDIDINFRKCLHLDM